VDWFFLQLKDWEDDEVGMSMPDAQRHGPPVTLSGVTYAQTVELINGYTVTFEDTGSPYTVRCTGANHNLADVTNYTSEVSLIIGNSAGLIVTTGGAGASAAEVWQYVGASAVDKEDDLIKARKAAEAARNLSA
jgi:hypothetical protein